MNKVYLGDCLEIMPTLPDKSIDLLVTDMPYDLFDFTWLEIGFNKLKDNGSAYIITDYRSVVELKLALDKLGIFRNWIVWCYGIGHGKRNEYRKSHADILFYTKTNNYCFNILRDKKTNALLKDWWLIKSLADKSGYLQHDNEYQLHPFQKPIALIERIISVSSKAGDTILDCFSGSGTTGVACKNLNRNFILIEKDPKYYEIILKRLE